VHVLQPGQKVKLLDTATPIAPPAQVSSAPVK
jgi:hypothetical protein